MRDFMVYGNFRNSLYILAKWIIVFYRRNHEDPLHECKMKETI